MKTATCALLAEPHAGLAEGLRMLLGTMFDTVVLVADERSLLEAAERVRPTLVVVELSMAHGDLGGLLRQLRARCRGQRVLVLSAGGGRSVAAAVLACGADGFLTKRDVGSGLVGAVEAVMRGDVYPPSLLVADRPPLAG